MLSNIILVIVSFSKLLKAAADRIMHEATLKGWGGGAYFIRHSFIIKQIFGELNQR
jgi:hypothetical protein